MTDYLALVFIVAALLEGTHAALVQAIRSKRPELLGELGPTGPGYYFFGLFAFEPAYRRSLGLRLSLLWFPRLSKNSPPFAMQLPNSLRLLCMQVKDCNQPGRCSF